MPTKSKGEGSNPFELELSKRAQEIKFADSKLVNTLEKSLTNTNKNKVYRGILGSGDVFNIEVDRMLWIHDIFNNDSEDMESIGCYKVENYYSFLPFFIL